MNIFGGIKILWIFLGSSQNWAIFRGHFYAFLGFFLSQGTEWGIIFGVPKISNILFGVLEIPYIFGGER